MRKAAAYSLGQLKDTPALPRLLSLLKDSAPWVRDAAVLALARFGDGVVGPLVTAMDAEDPSFKILGLDVLGRINSEESGKIPERYVNDPHPGVRRTAGRLMRK